MKKMEDDNQKKGKSFEEELAKILSDNGFWVRIDRMKRQSCDLLVAKDNISYLIECKTCERDYFNFNRIRDNQVLSRKKFLKCGNENAWIAYKVGEKDIYFHKDFIKKPAADGIKISKWIKEINTKYEINRDDKQ